MASLREKAIKGGAFLLVRQGLGMAVSVVGILLVTRTIGPRQYGLFAAAMGIVTFLSYLGTWGLDVYLLRKPEDPREQEFIQALTLLLIIGVILAGAVITLRFVISAFLKMPQESTILPIMAVAIPLNLLSLPAVAKLDRDLNFKQVAVNEFTSQITWYAVAIPLAFAGAGAWAPVLGFVSRQVCLLGLSYTSARFRPALHWDSRLVKTMLNYGLAYSSSQWIYRLRSLVNPLIVGRFVGATGVGYVAVAVRIAETLSCASLITWRIAMPALAKLNNNVVRLRASITEGMRFQAVSVGVPLALFALAARFVMPVAFGHNWSSASRVFPFIALSFLSTAMVNLHASVLYMLGKNLQMALFHTIHIALFAGGAALLVPRLGFIGYGWAEIVALPSYFVLHRLLVKAVGRPSYSAPIIWYATAAGVVVLGAFGASALYLGFATLAAPLFFRKERATLSSYAKIIFSRATTPA